jgi:hypothetical protein
MRTMNRPFLKHASALVLLSTAWHAAHAQVPPMKPGLWEVTPESQQLNGKPLPDVSTQMAEQLKRMPPEMRARMEAQMKAQGIQMTPGAGGKGMTVRTCITKEMLAENRWQGTDGRCQHTLLKPSGNTWNWKFRCTEPQSEGEGSTTFEGSEAYRSVLHMTTARNGQKQTMDMTHKARWIGSDCGSIQPPGAQAKP